MNAATRTCALAPVLAFSLMPAVTPGHVQAQTRIDRAGLVSLSASVLKVEVRRIQGGYNLGSGVVVAEGRIVTNCHVTRDAAAIHILRGGARWPVTAQVSDPVLDLCVLDSPLMRGVPVQMGQADSLRPGTPLAALGYTGGLGLQVSEGQVFALHRHAGSHVIQSTTFFSSGASGGGLFDADMNLVGLLTFRRRGGAAHYYAAPVEWLRPLLDAQARHDPIGPDASFTGTGASPSAYWEDAGDSQPRFLRAALLEQGARWRELLALGTTWGAATPDDAEPWYWRGIALAHLNLAADAQAALEQALERSPDWSAALHRLGLVLIQRDQPEAARAVLARLRPRDTVLTQDLERALAAACQVAASARPCAMEPA